MRYHRLTITATSNKLIVVAQNTAVELLALIKQTNMHTRKHAQLVLAS